MTDDSDIEWCTSQARLLIRGGFMSREDAIDQLQQYIDSDNLAAVLSADVLVDAEIAALKSEQASWPSTTDFDRLELAFQKLTLEGVLPRHDFTCCGTCGAAEIEYEIEDEQKRGNTIKGYVFYHQQDTESAVDGYGLYFNYGAADHDATETDHVGIGKELSKALSDAGLKVNWDGTLGKRVGVSLDWKRPWGSKTAFIQGGSEPLYET